MKRDLVHSSTFASLTDSPSQTLEAEYQDGSIYQYLGVPDDVWRRFQLAPSKGTFYIRYIKDNYAFRRLHQIPVQDFDGMLLPGGRRA